MVRLLRSSAADVSLSSAGKSCSLIAVEAVRLPRHADVVLDVRPLGHELVGGDLEALEQ